MKFLLYKNLNQDEMKIFNRFSESESWSTNRCGPYDGRELGDLEFEWDSQSWSINTYWTESWSLGDDNADAGWSECFNYFWGDCER